MLSAIDERTDIETLKTNDVAFTLLRHVSDLEQMREFVALRQSPEHQEGARQVIEMLGKATRKAREKAQALVEGLTGSDAQRKATRDLVEMLGSRDEVKDAQLLIAQNVENTSILLETRSSDRPLYEALMNGLRSEDKDKQWIARNFIDLMRIKDPAVDKLADLLVCPDKDNEIECFFS